MERAAQLGLAAIAVTDHDTVSGVAEAVVAAHRHGFEFLPGTELSAECDGIEVHVIGLGIQPDSFGLLQVLQRLKQERASRADRMVERLRALGIPIERAALETPGAEGTIGRMHVARELKRLGYAKTVQEAFDRYLGCGKAAFVEKARLTCPDAITFVHEAGGLAFLAHPGFNSLKRLLQKLLSYPFDGLEAYHVQHSPGQVTQFLELAKDHNILISGGSDCHGKAKGLAPEMGKVRVPYEHFERIKTALAQRSGR